MDKTQTGAGLAENGFHDLILNPGALKAAIAASTGAAILTDHHVASRCLDKFFQLLPQARVLPVLAISPGEESKNIQSLENILEFLSHQGLDRNALLICLGGGMITDLGGFASSVYKRGISCFFVPTSLMAMVDAAWGGKTGVDFRGVKNMLGTFRFNTPVFLHTPFLESLPERRKREAIAEMIKHELLSSATTLQSAEFLTNIKKDRAEAIIQWHIATKMKWVEADPLEKNQRKFLNLGHTLGHAIESVFLSESRETYHGECVAAGLIFALLLSVKEASFPEQLASDHCFYIRRNILLRFERIPSWEELKVFILQDKKNTGVTPSWVLLNASLQPFLHSAIPEEKLRMVYESEPFKEFLR